MGYTQDTALSQFVTSKEILKTAGTWTDALNSHMVTTNRTAATTAFALIIPLALPGNGAYRLGSRLKSIDLYYTIGTADFTDLAAPTLEVSNLPSSDQSVSGSQITAFTLDADHDTADKRKAQGDHTLTITLTDPIWIPRNQALYLAVACTPAATSTFSLFGARMNYTERK